MTDQKQLVDDAVILSAEIYLDLLDAVIVRIAQARRDGVPTIVLASALQNAFYGLENFGGESAISVAQRITTELNAFPTTENVSELRGQFITRSMITGGIGD